MHFSGKAFLVVLLFLLSFSVSAIVPARFLGEPKDMDDFTVASFNKILSASRLAQAERVNRYIERGLAYSRLFRFREAIGDFSEALRLDPNKVEAYYHRAVAAARLENYARAYEDFGTALNLDHAFYPALLQRAYLYFLNGKYQEAGQDFTRYLQKNPEDLYRVLWLYLSERYQQSRQTVVRRYTQGRDLNQWPGAMLELYMGDVPLANLVKALKPQLSSWDKEHRCEAYYYLGQYHLIRGESKQALAYFQEAVKTRARSQIEYEFSITYLKQLSQATVLAPAKQVK